MKDGIKIYSQKSSHVARYKKAKQNKQIWNKCHLHNKVLNPKQKQF